VSALSIAWNNRLQSLTLDGFQLEDSFFPAVLQQLPGLQSLSLPTILCNLWLDNMAACFMALCSQLTKPLKLSVPPEIHK
jgi:hypothetical protein